MLSRIVTAGTVLRFNRNKITLKHLSFNLWHVSFLVIFVLFIFGWWEASGKESRHRPFKHVVKLIYPLTAKLYVTNLFNSCMFYTEMTKGLVPPNDQKND